MLYRQLRLVLSTEDKEQYLEQPIPTAPVVVAPDQPIPPAALATYNEWVKNQKEIVVIIKQNGTPSTIERFPHGKPEEGQSVQLLMFLTWGRRKMHFHVMLKLHEATLPNNKLLHGFMPSAGKVQKNKNKKPSKVIAKKLSHHIHRVAEKKLLSHGARSFSAIDGMVFMEIECLVPINVRSITRMRVAHDGLLNSNDIESLGKCVSCMSGKMARKPYSHQVKTAKDLLGLIHIDVCGPFRIVSRQGANYFVTFTDDFSQLWLCLLAENKHDSMKTFKVFQTGSRKSTRKIIKSLRSDHGEHKFYKDLLVPIATFYVYEIWQMDVKTAFLNGHLFEEVYMRQPEGNNIPMLQDVKSYLGKYFAVKDLGEAAYILGIKIYRDRSKRLIGLCQSAYIEKILKRYYMENSKRGTIPMQEKLKLRGSRGDGLPQTPV
ncbi:retrotransposon protein, putative, ty1-copia subclass [Tanacetum coccineum]